jgi:hypothetical protein
MDDKEKLLWMFKEVHGEMTGACSAKLVYGEDCYDPIGVACIKGGAICWQSSKIDLVFNYLTKHLD